MQDVNIVSTWNTDRAKAEQIFSKLKKYEGETSDFYTIASEGYTLLVPYGSKIIGLNNIEIDYSLDDISINEDAGNEDEISDEDVDNLPSSLIDMIMLGINMTHRLKLIIHIYIKQQQLKDYSAPIPCLKTAYEEFEG